MALEKLSEKEKNERIKQNIDWAIVVLKAKLNPIDLDEKTTKSYVGTFGPRKITFENDALYYQREDNPKMKMIPMNKNTFRFEEIDYFHLQIIKEGDEVVGVKGLYDTGRTDENKKSKG